VYILLKRKTHRERERRGEKIMRSSSTSGEKGTEFTFSVSLNMNCLSYLKIKETEEFKQFALSRNRNDIERYGVDFHIEG